MHESCPFFPVFVFECLPKIAFESRVVLIFSLDDNIVAKVSSCVTQEMFVVLTVKFLKKTKQNKKTVDETKLSLLGVQH